MGLEPTTTDQKRAATGERFEVQEGAARLWVNLRDYLDTGLFLDHRPVRRMLGEIFTDGTLLTSRDGDNSYCE